MRRMAWTVALVMGLQIALVGGIHVLLSPAPWRDAEGPGFRCSLPWQGAPKTVAMDGWTGVKAGWVADWQVLVRPLAGDPAAAVRDEAARLHPRPVERLSIPGVRDALFLLSGRGKHWQATLLVPRGDRLLRADVLESRGNAAEPLASVARLAASVRPAGSAFEPPDRDLLEAVVEPAVARHLVALRSVLPVVLVAIVPALVLALGVTWFSGRLPGRAPGAPPPLLAEAGAWVARGRGLRYKASVGALVLDRDGLRVHVWGREVAHVPASELDTIRRVTGRRRHRPFRYDGGPVPLRFAPADPDRWAAALGLRDGDAPGRGRVPPPSLPARGGPR